MAKPLTGQVAIITGASRGIGRDVALLFAANGTREILLSQLIMSLHISNILLYTPRMQYCCDCKECGRASQPSWNNFFGRQRGIVAQHSINTRMNCMNYNQAYQLPR
jgi:hypothetical protein